MTPEIITVLVILIVTALLFISNKIRPDLIGLLVLGALALSGVITPAQSLAGFSNPAVITVWAVLILSGGLARTGIASQLGRLVLRLAGTSEVKLLLIIMLTSGVLSGFMNSIGVASLFLPVVLDITRRINRPPSRLLIPLAFACLLGGLTTLIGTPANILISESLGAAGFAPFQLFDYSALGYSLLAAGTLYMVLAGRHLLPRKDITKDFSASYPGVTEYYDFQERLAFIQLPNPSHLDGKTLQVSRLGAALELNVVMILRGQETIHAPAPSFILHSGDRLLVQGRLDILSGIDDEDHKLITREPLPIKKIYSAEVQLAEAQIPAGGSIVGMTLQGAAFRHVYKAIVLAIRRNETVFYTDLEDIALQEKDILLVKGHQADLQHLASNEDFTLTFRESYPEYDLEDHLVMVRIPPDSLLAGTSLVNSRLGDAFGLSVQGIIRDRQTELMPEPDEILQVDDILIVKGSPEDLNTIRGLQNLSIETQVKPDLTELETEETGLLEAVLSPHSSLAGKKVRELDFRSRYGLTVLAIWRNGRAYRSHLRDMQIKMGDAFLLFGPRRKLRLFGSIPDFLVLSEEAQLTPRTSKAPLAILIMALVLIPAIFNFLPIAISAVIGVALMVLTGVLQMDEAYRLIEWRAVFLIAGLLPLGTALESSGAAQLISDSLLGLVGSAGPLVLVTALYALASLATQIMPNPAVAVLLAPIALSAAAESGISPYPLLMTIAAASSAVFLSPIGHPANLLVMGPGGYRFSDYLKAGLPLTILTWAVIIVLMPLLWPF
jgi:di/tricarboxylate transporter